MLSKRFYRRSLWSLPYPGHQQAALQAARRSARPLPATTAAEERQPGLEHHRELHGLAPAERLLVANGCARCLPLDGQVERDVGQRAKPRLCRDSKLHCELHGLRARTHTTSARACGSCTRALGDGAGGLHRWKYLRAHSPEQRQPARRPKVDLSARWRERLSSSPRLRNMPCLRTKASQCRSLKRSQRKPFAVTFSRSARHSMAYAARACSANARSREVNPLRNAFERFTDTQSQDLILRSKE